MSAYDVIFFDLDHTLVDTRQQYHLGVPKAMRALYGDAWPDTFLERFLHHHELLWPNYDRRVMTMEELRRERFLRAWRDFGVEKDAEEARRFHEAYMAAFPETLRPYPETHRLLEALSPEHRLAIITNGSPDMQWEKVRLCGLDRYFSEEVLFISERIGHAKPHPSVYQAAMTGMGVAARDALMIGDNYQADIEGARACGMDAVWYVPDPEGFRQLCAQVSDPPLHRAEDVVARVRELEAARS
ncbi:HAD family hydrolase [Alicyclobacillus macrosporangiidus]|uniref:HAD family hydrolase n=1 Tax=Alicyclobacillus macrosporangiidus TaxID=392015 RepID=UPI00068FEBB2|nr:HAD family hydrolase [Alicyclobacillus macrosporangiidus]